uniref:Uncharacterized protein n=1 Tax=Anguilla anguilla TaxID=7936 RepID=A0A0E9SXE8_ANGAN
MFRLFITPRMHGLQLHFEHMTLISRAPNCCPNLNNALYRTVVYHVENKGVITSDVFFYFRVLVPPL